MVRTTGVFCQVKLHTTFVCCIALQIAIASGQTYV